MKFSETMSVGYTRMQQEVREQNIEIKKMAQQNAERHLEERKIRIMGPSKETIKRLRMKSEQLKLASKGITQQERPTLVKRK